MAEADAFPPSPAPPATPAQAAEAAVKAVLDQQAATAKEKADAKEFVDPGQQPWGDSRLKSEEAAEKKPEPTVEGASVGDDKDHKELIDRAIALDMTEEDAKAIPPTALRRYVTRLERNERLAREPQPAQARAPEPEPEPEQWELPPFASETEDVEIEPGLLKGLSVRDAEIAKLRQETAELKRRDEQRQAQIVWNQQQQQFREYEKLVQADEDLRDELGDGKKPPAEGTKQLANNRKLIDTVGFIMNRDGCSMDEAYQEARASMFRDKLDGKKSKTLSDKLTRQSGRFIKPPTGKKEAAETFGRDSAIDKLAEAMASRDRK